jgi:pimeloyl-ACP methyl ester carboxylesterase
VVGTQDQVITEAQQVFMAERAGSAITRIESGHLSPISHPDEVTAVILDAVAAG